MSAYNDPNHPDYNDTNQGDHRETPEDKEISRLSAALFSAHSQRDAALTELAKAEEKARGLFENCESTGQTNAALLRKLAALPADWLEDSSLETWFPMTAETLATLRTELLDTQAKLTAALEEVEKWETVADCCATVTNQTEIQLAAALADTRRLDWLEKTGRMPMNMGRKWTVAMTRTSDPLHSTMRDAIDATMSAQH